MGIFFKVLATKHAIFKFYGSSLREATKTVKLGVVAVTHGDDHQLFSCRQKECDKKKLRVVAVTHGDDYQLFSCRQKERDKKK